jgi:poly-gamma-glutamate capsule biosynthesis protein CapA/YwtB (metallophosphatase superfamily)
MMQKAAATLIGLSTLLAFPALGQHRSADESFTMALTGDSIINRSLSVYDEPQYLEMIEVLRGADVAVTNLETVLHNFEPYPMAESGGTWMRSDPKMAEELAWAGIDMVARANNHTGDYGTLGLELTTKYVEQAGLVDAGVGMSLAEAREARFLETSKARVALISLSSSFANHMRAGRSRDDVPARPGLNPLRVKTTYILPEDSYENIRGAADSLGQFTDLDGQPRGTDEEKPGQMNVLGRNFAVGEAPRVLREPNEDDVAEIMAVINNASRLADFTIVTIHSHQNGGRRELPDDFLPVFARAAIEAGADVFFGHGPHILQGIEIYQGKPILYSLGNFIFQNETLLRLPSDNYERYALGERSHVADFNDARYENDSTGFPALQENWEAIIAVPTFENRQLTELALYPIDLGFGKTRQIRGRPILADDDLGQKIMADLARLSEPFGTEFEYRRGVGYVKLNDRD